ncbi:uncharacterized protein LOC143034085 isoform X1 [Oratosquilla oratoria]|uniref:uncharacterized protein LOC143034085 isoform X1 n=1 Tax=Oratosquilla oratoria TaxID=337810 RepID=UPI003F761EF5
MKAMRCELENCNGDVKEVASRKNHSKHSDSVHAMKFVEKLQKKKGAARSRQGNVDLGERDGHWSSDYEKSTEQGSLLLLIQEAQGPTTHRQGPREPPYKSQETPQQGQKPSQGRDALVLLK